MTSSPSRSIHYRITLICLGSMGYIRSCACHWTRTKKGARQWIAEQRKLNRWDTGEIMEIDTLRTERVGKNHSL